MGIGEMEFRLFGEVEVLAAGRRIDVGTPRQQAVLAALLVDAGRPVAIETLIDRVWADKPPVEARNILYSHLSRIRNVLRQAGGDAEGTCPTLQRRHAGYVLTVDVDLVDLLRFARMVDRGVDPALPDAERARMLGAALALWRGSPLAAVTGEWADQVRYGAHRRRLEAAVQWARGMLRLGEPGAVTAALPDLVTDYPLAEPLECVLMEALHAVGRDAEAVERYGAIRRRLADELGTDPGTELRSVHRAILRGELPPPPTPRRAVPAPAAATHPPGTREPSIAPPAQLPPDVFGFTGRASELRRLDGLLAGADPEAQADDRPGGGTVVISAIDGTAGVGKTALAVHWAHRVADRFPDGQLYANLQGFDPAGSPVEPAEAVRRFLTAFDVPPERIPPDFEAQVGLYRSLLARRRVLVVLDNARDAAQVRPLLPGSGGSVAVVTSRNQLAGLIAATGAQLQTVDLLSPAEARDLLARRVGADRMAAHPDAVDEIIALCARLPLALAIVAARAATHPRFGLDVLARELRRAHGGLDGFASGDPTMDARVVFSWSYRQRSPAGARLFRLLGLHPGPDLTAPAAASLAGVSVNEVRPLLAELTRAHLLAEHAPGRYLCHDLLRVYAGELARSVDTDADRRAALRRTLSHYTHTADIADRLVNPHRDGPTTLPPLPSGVVAERPVDPAHALAWLHAEHAVLLSLIRQVVDFDLHTCRLAWTVTRFQDYQGDWHTSIAVLDTAMKAADRLADPAELAIAHRLLGCDYIRLGRLDEARAELRQAIDRYHAAGDRVGEGHTHRYYSWLLQRQGRYREALGYAERAVELFQAADHRSGEGRALNAVGWFHALLGELDKAIGYCGRALAMQREMGDRYGQAETCDSLGHAQHRLGRYDEAIVSYQTAAELYRQFGDRCNAADTTAHLGDVYRAAGDFAAARAAWEDALDVLARIDDNAARSIRARLDELAFARRSALY